MKKILSFLFILVFTQQLFAIIPPSRDTFEVLAAVRDEKQFEFPLMRGIKIWDNTNKKTDGVLTKITQDSITIASFIKRKIWDKKIAIKDIVDAQPYSRKNILFAKIGTLVSIGLGILGLVSLSNNGRNVASNAIAGVLVAVFVSLLLTSFGIVWLLHIVQDSVERKSINGGWEFKAAKLKQSKWKRFWRRQKGV